MHQSNGRLYGHPKAKDSASIGEHNAIAAICPISILFQQALGIVLEHCLDVASIGDADVASTRVERHQSKLLAGLSHRGRVDHWHQQRRLSKETAIEAVEVGVVKLSLHTPKTVTVGRHAWSQLSCRHHVHVGPQVVPHRNDPGPATVMTRNDDNDNNDAQHIVRLQICGIERDSVRW